MFYNFKEQILKSIETGTEYLHRRYFSKNIQYRIVGTFFAKVFVPLSSVL